MLSTDASNLYVSITLQIKLTSYYLLGLWNGLYLLSINLTLARWTLDNRLIDLS